MAYLTVHEWAAFPQKDAPTLLAALNDKSQAVYDDIYYTSKLLDNSMTRELAKLPAAQKVVVSGLNSGLCVSELPGLAQTNVKRLIMHQTGTFKSAKSLLYILFSPTQALMIYSALALYTGKAAPYIEEHGFPGLL